MNTIVKTINNKDYVYMVTREGGRVTHRYLGPASNPEITAFIGEKKNYSMIPEFLQNLFWDADHSKIGLRKNARYIIERILEYGDLSAIDWLQHVYTLQQIADILFTSRNISEKSRNFWLIWFEGENAYASGMFFKKGLGGSSRRKRNR